MHGGVTYEATNPASNTPTKKRQANRHHKRNIVDGQDQIVLVARQVDVFGQTGSLRIGQIGAVEGTDN